MHLQALGITYFFAMILNVGKTTQASMTLVLLGSEEWLRAIYASFRPSASVLTGRVKVVPSHAGQVEVEGDLNYEPLVNCSRCWDEVVCPLQVKFKACYRKYRRQKLPKTLTLRKEDFDVYYYDGERIDLSELINERVQLALPDSTVPVGENGSSCEHCRVDLCDPLVYETRER